MLESDLDKRHFCQCSFYCRCLVIRC